MLLLRLGFIIKSIRALDGLAYDRVRPGTIIIDHLLTFVSVFRSLDGSTAELLRLVRVTRLKTMIRRLREITLAAAKIGTFLNVLLVNCAQVGSLQPIIDLVLLQFNVLTIRKEHLATNVAWF